MKRPTLLMTGALVLGAALSATAIAQETAWRGPDGHNQYHGAYRHGPAYSHRYPHRPVRGYWRRGHHPHWPAYAYIPPREDSRYGVYLFWNGD